MSHSTKRPRLSIRQASQHTGCCKSRRSPAPAAANPQADKQLQDAQDEYVHGRYASAIENAKHAVKAQPSKAWRIIGASQCFLKNREGAVQAWNKLDAQGRQFLKYVCSRNAITVP